MVTSIPIDEFLGLAQRHPSIDVRSPGEFRLGHIPGAVNVPLFSDEERARIGTTYKQVGREPAIELGHQLAQPRVPVMLEQVRSVASTEQLLVHCWRGGMRSRGVAELLNSNGYPSCTLEGGYKAYRREVHRSFADPRQIVIVGGLSGSGKTNLLAELRRLGEQVIDLEGLAHHRGSAFGGIGLPAQPTQEQFENNLFGIWSRLDPARVVWLESENVMVGRVAIPDPLWQQMLAAPAVSLEMHREERIQRLVDEYGDLPLEELEIAIDKIERRLGGQRHTLARRAAARGDMSGLARVVLEYYDKAYERANRQYERSQCVCVAATSVRPSDLAQNLVKIAASF